MSVETLSRADAERNLGIRVGFVVPGWTAGNEAWNPGIPFRSLSVATALTQAGYEVLYFEQKHFETLLNHGIEEFLDSLSSVAAVIVWQNDLNPMTQTRNTLDLASLIKERYPKLPTVAGGTFISICPPETLAIESSVDYWIRGYGEEACIELLESLRNDREITDVSGLSWHDRDRGFQANDERARQRMHASHNDFYFDRDLSPYIQEGGIFGNREETFLIGSARGCAKGCTFCYWRGFAPSLLSGESIVDIAEHIHTKYGIRQFHLAELDFFTNRKRPLTLARLWKERLPNCQWFSLCSPQDAIKFSDEDWDLLATGGCAKLEMGAETGSEEMLKVIGKKHHPDDPVRIAKKMLERGITPMMNFLFGLVGETPEHRKATLRLIYRVFSLAPDRVHLTFRFYQPAWATPMGEKAIATTSNYPKTLLDVVEFRGHYGTESDHTMKWLKPEEEREIKEMVYHFLPLALSNFPLENPGRRFLYRALRKLARYRLKFGYFKGDADRRIYKNHVEACLPTTYLA